MQHLSGQDATFLYLDRPGAHLQLTGLYVYEQPGRGPARLAFEDIRGLIAEALVGVGALRLKLVRPPFDIDYPFWAEDPDYHLERHLFRRPGPAPRSRRALFQAVAAIHAEPLDLAHAPWEMHVFERLNGIAGLPPRSFAIVMKYHHAAIDGASGAALVDRLHGVAAPGGGAGSGASPDSTPGTLGLLARAAYNNGLNAVGLSRALASSVPAMWRGVWRAASFQKPVEPPVPETRFNGPVSPERVMDTVSIPMERLRAIREAVPGATVNDVLLAVCGGALRRWLGRRGELPQEPLVAMVPVNARAGHEEDLPGNHLSMRFLPIGTHLPDPLERLEAVHRASLHAKSGEAGLDARQASAIARHVPALPLAGVARLVTGLGLGYRALRLCNCTITNVPANRPGLRLGPARLVQVSGIGPIIDGMGLLISIFSYAGMANLSFTSCPQMLPDPETLARDTERELRRLERAMERAA